MVQHLTLATGTYKISSNPCFMNRTSSLQRKAQRGFTLLEVMLIIVLIGVSAVAVVMSLPSNTDDAAHTRAQQLYQRLNLLHQDAILNGWDLGVRFDEPSNSYTLLHLTQDGWQLLEHRRMPAETKFEDGVALNFELGGGVWGKTDTLFDKGPLFDEDMFADVEKKDKPKQEKPPQVFILSSGELTPFEAFIHPKSTAMGETNWRVQALENGTFRILAPGEVADDKKQ